MSCMSYNAVWELNTRLVRLPRLIYKEFETTPCPTGTSEKYGRIADQPCGRAWSRCTSSESCTAQRRSDVERTSRLKWWRCVVCARDTYTNCLYVSVMFLGRLRTGRVSFATFCQGKPQGSWRSHTHVTTVQGCIMEYSCASGQRGYDIRLPCGSGSDSPCVIGTPRHYCQCAST